MLTFRNGSFFVTRPPSGWKSRKTDFGNFQKRQKCVFGHFLTSDVTLILDFFASFWIWLIALMKLFSLGGLVSAPPTKFPTPVAIEKYRGTIIALRTSVMVWFLDGPPDRRFAHSVQMLQTERRRVLLYFFGTDLKMTKKQHILFSFDAHVETTRSPQRSYSKHCSLFLSDRFWTVQNTTLDRYASTYYVVQFNYPTTHPVFVTPASKKWLKYSTGTIKLSFCYSWKIKNSMSETFEKRGRRLIWRRDRLATFYFTGKFEWAYS